MLSDILFELLGLWWQIVLVDFLEIVVIGVDSINLDPEELFEFLGGNRRLL